MRSTTLCYTLLIIIYIVLSFMSPVPAKTLHQYHITAFDMRLLSLAVMVPYVAIWGAAFYGYVKLSDYAHMIKRNADGKAIQKLARGLLCLALWLPVTSIVSILFTNISNSHSEFATPAAIMNDYLGLIIPFVGFLYIGIGASDFSKITKRHPSQLAKYVTALILISVGVVYTHLVTTTQNALNAQDHVDTITMLITLVIPYIFMWYVGMIATYEIYAYQLRVKGILYGRSLKLLAIGMALLIITSIFLQYLSTLSNRLTSLSLNGVLALIYLLLLILGVSYVLIAVGAKRLQKIEEV